MNTVDNAVVKMADTTLLLRHQFTYEQRTILCLEVQFIEHAFVDDIHSLRPILLTIVGTSLMQQDALDDTYLLCLLSQSNEFAVWIVVIALAEVLVPISSLGNILLTQVLIEEIDISTANCHMHYTYLYAFWQLLYQRATEIIGRSQTSPLTAERWNSGIPSTLLSSDAWHVNSREHTETSVDILTVLRFNSCISLHVRLSETQINMEVRVKLRRLRNITCSLLTVTIVQNGILFVKLLDILSLNNSECRSKD